MSLNDPLANVLDQIKTADKKGRAVVIVKPISKTTLSVLSLLKDNNYLGEFKKIEDGKGGKIEINLLGAINETNVIKPRYSVKLEEFEKFEQRYLPAHGFGFLIVSTNQGMMTHEQAIKKNFGGRLIAYIY